MNTPRTIEEIEKAEDQQKGIDFVNALTERCNGNQELQDICQKLQAMSPEDKVGFMYEFIENLPKEREYRKLKKMLRHQPIPVAEWERLTYYTKRLAADTEDKYHDFYFMLDLFHYGRICGIREERAKRKGEKWII